MTTGSQEPSALLGSVISGGHGFTGFVLRQSDKHHKLPYDTRRKVRLYSDLKSCVAQLGLPPSFVAPALRYAVRFLDERSRGQYLALGDLARASLYQVSQDISYPLTAARLGSLNGGRWKVLRAAHILHQVLGSDRRLPNYEAMLVRWAVEIGFTAAERETLKFDWVKIQELDKALLPRRAAHMVLAHHAHVGGHSKALRAVLEIWPAQQRKLRVAYAMKMQPVPPP